MESIHVYGGISLQGKVKIQGSKNAALPILAATILTKEVTVLQNCPRIADVYQMLQLLSCLGCTVVWKEDGVYIDASKVSPQKMPAEAITGMRSSLCLLGALLGRFGEVVMEYPGGCIIGARPIDLHLSALEKMGVCFEKEHHQIKGTSNKGLHGAEIHLEKASVGATENILLAAVMAEGITWIYNAALEPEVEALCYYLQQCGANIKGIGTDTLCITGGRKLSGTKYKVPADRIVAGTYLIACLTTGGNILLEEAPVEHMEALLKIAKKLGTEYHMSEEGLYIQAPEKLRGLDILQTQAYPGFPTDLQSIALAMLTRMKGTCLVEEQIFENRFRIVEPLIEMGANITKVDSSKVVVKGPCRLHGTQVEAKELRGGAALVVAGLAAEGETIIKGCQYISRGYENICKDFRELGARIYSV